MDRAELLSLFVEEGREHVASFEAALLGLERTPTDADLLALAFRCVHSLKGGSAMMGFADVVRFSHALETVLDHLRSGRRPVTASIVETLLAATDVLGRLVAEAGTETPPSAADRAEADRIVVEIGIFAGESVALVVAPASALPLDGGPRQSYEIEFRAPLTLLRRCLDPLDLIDTLAEVGDLTATVDAGRLPSLTELDPEACYLGWRLRLTTERPRADIERCFEWITEPGAVTIRSVSAPEPAVAHDDRPGASGDREPQAPVVRVPVHKVDLLVDLVGELATTHAMLAQVVAGLAPERAGRLQETVSQIDRQVRELHEAIMSVRMVSVRALFARFPRLVRDAAAATGKRVGLQTEGNETEIDKTVMELIADPLVHLVRNAIDHGLEAPEARRAAGKLEVGALRIAAYQQGGHVYIEVADDGAGLDRDRIAAKAVQRGLLAPGQTVSDAEALELIMRPGFSTTETVTQLSGRGVGMDVVKRTVEMLGGSLTARSQRGQGTMFRIELPLTLAMLDGQILQVGGQDFVLPLVAITESVRPAPGSVHALPDHGEILVVRGATVPLLRLHRLFDIPLRSEDPGRGIAIIVEHEERRAALLVDALAGQQQVVVKSLETGFGKPDGMAAATILGDGHVAVILDVPGLIRLAASGRRRTAA